MSRKYICHAFLNRLNLFSWFYPEQMVKNSWPVYNSCQASPNVNNFFRSAQEEHGKYNDDSSSVVIFNCLYIFIFYQLSKVIFFNILFKNIILHFYLFFWFYFYAVFVIYLLNIE